jgi:hypothetical protein
MTWFKVDDTLAFHHKTAKAGNAAMGLWVRAGSWSAAHLTDGFVPEHMIALLGTPAQAQRLIKSGLWETADGGYFFHEWSEPGRQPSSASVRAERKKSSERQAAWRERNAEKRQLSVVRNGVTEAFVTGAVTPSVTGAPTRPDPTSSKEEKTPSSPRSRATRISEDFRVSPEMVAWAREKTPSVDGATETEKFRLYWSSKSGKDATKIDWEKTWKMWMLNAKDRSPTGRARPSGKTQVFTSPNGVQIER